jgi:hypothetical protein
LPLDDFLSCLKDAGPPKNRQGPRRRFLGPDIFDRVCVANGIQHRPTNPYHPWTNAKPNG